VLQRGAFQRIVNTAPCPRVYPVRQSLDSVGATVAIQLELRTPFRSRFAMTMNTPVDTLSVDEALVRAAQQGDRVAFGILYSRYARMVHGILLCRVPCSAVEDLVQDVFLQALPRLASLRDISRFPGWLAAIARNRAMDFHRQSHPHDEFNEESPEADGNPHPPNRPTPHTNMEAQAVLNAILRLPEAYRQPLILRLVEGMTGPEIAARTGLTHGSVRVNLHRGMQQLREILGHRANSAASPATSGDL
jgi:RNA polymerase sigma-70 factor, ECF subfamily